MTPEQTLAIQTTFARIVPCADATAAHFYRRLFELDPSLRAMFPADMQEQRRKLVSILQVVIAGLNDLSRLVPAIEALGRRHATYGVADHHYALVGQALLETLEAGLGEDWTVEVAQAWTVAYTILSTVMQTAARGARAISPSERHIVAA